eukprot:TRINITY_DN15155_c0_g1_i1.p1 TRINITY_DN15155_c0_g1~~TRINITY_DN15155_c0_g1_i1.p1  ORF type:complete len:160 (+),score=23.79 TRINITY_DN15155_c0_g1_i1:67-546(+)
MCIRDRIKSSFVPRCMRHKSYDSRTNSKIFKRTNIAHNDSRYKRGYSNFRSIAESQDYGSYKVQTLNCLEKQKNISLAHKEYKVKDLLNSPRQSYKAYNGSAMGEMKSKLKRRSSQLESLMMKSSKYMKKVFALEKKREGIGEVKISRVRVKLPIIIKR